MGRVRVGTVAYVNAAPLTLKLDPTRFEVVAEHPRAIAAALAEGRVDVALAPVAAVLTDDAYRIVPGVCVGADGPVHSVVIAAETPPEAWSELVLDGTSRTSVVLARLLVTQGPLASRVSSSLRVVDGAPGDGPKRVGGTVAAVVIGDPARSLPPHLARWDLAELWKQWTGKPFVFAVWAARPDLPAGVQRALAEAGRAGVAAIPQAFSVDDRDYLERHLRYDLDDHALVGLRRFAAVAHRAGLVGTEHVHLFGPAPSLRPRRPDTDRVLADAADGVVPTLEQAAALLRQVPVTDLGLAAGLAAQRRHGAGRATYLVEHRVAPGVVAAGGEALGQALACAGEVSAVRLRGLDVLDGAARRDRLAAAKGAGLPAWGLRAAVAQDLDALVDAGLAALTWRVHDAVPVAVAEARRLALPVHAELVVGDEATFLRALAVLRDAPVTSAAVHLPLPPGALVEPGRPTPSAWMRALAVVRLATSVPHVVASPLTQGLDGSQPALLLGADDLGPVGEGALDALGAGEAWPSPLEAAERVVRLAGLEPVRRDLSFHEVGGALTRLRRVRPVSERAGHA